MNKYRESLDRARPPMPAFPATRFVSHTQEVNSILPFDAFGAPGTEMASLIERLKPVTFPEIEKEIISTLVEHEQSISELLLKLRQQKPDTK